MANNNELIAQCRAKAEEWLSPSFDEETRKELIKRGFITEKAKSVTALAYRPGWHAGDLPFFPQGGKKVKGSNYGNIHRWNQVVFEIEIDADKDYTEEAQNQPKARKEDGSLNPKKQIYSICRNMDFTSTQQTRL